MTRDLGVDFEELREGLSVLPRRAQLAFLLSCTERLFPNYQAFVRRHRWGDPGALEQALELGWGAFEGNLVPEEELHLALQRCERASPNTEDFDSELVSPALDAAVSAALVLEFVVEADPDKVVEAASLARDTVDMYVQEVEPYSASDPGLEQQIANHTMMKRELARQKADMRLLSAVDWTNPGRSLEAVRGWRRPKVSNIGQTRVD